MKGRSLVFGTPAAVDTQAGHVGLLVLRVFAGLALAFGHGLGKIPPSEGFVGMVGGMGMPAPEVAAWLAALAEFVGGLLLALGLLTRPVALVVAIHFAVVVVLAHAGDPFGRRELPLMFLAVALLYLLAGPGRYSADAAISGRR
jgi:putative oxidoreductase